MLPYSHVWKVFEQTGPGNHSTQSPLPQPLLLTGMLCPDAWWDTCTLTVWSVRLTKEFVGLHGVQTCNLSWFRHSHHCIPLCTAVSVRVSVTNRKRNRLIVCNARPLTCTETYTTHYSKGKSPKSTIGRRDLETAAWYFLKFLFIYYLIAKYNLCQKLNSVTQTKSDFIMFCAIWHLCVCLCVIVFGKSLSPVGLWKTRNGQNSENLEPSVSSNLWLMGCGLLLPEPHGMLSLRQPDLRSQPGEEIESQEAWQGLESNTCMQTEWQTFICVYKAVVKWISSRQYEGGFIMRIYMAYRQCGDILIAWCASYFTTGSSIFM